MCRRVRLLLQVICVTSFCVESSSAFQNSTQTCDVLDIKTNTWVDGKTLEKLLVPALHVPTSYCCDQCSQAQACEAWNVRKTDCFLQSLSKENKDLRSNLKGNGCVGRVNMGFHSGKVLKTVAAIGVTDAQKDASCCDLCKLDGECEGWQIVTRKEECQLMQLAHSSTGASAGFSSSPMPPNTTYDGTCNVIPGGAGKGKYVSKHVLVSLSQNELDAECCALCTTNPECEFWVRGTTGKPNWCRLMKSWTRTVDWKKKERMGFKKLNRADPMFCKVLKFMWDLIGDILQVVDFPSLGPMRNAKARLSGFQCDKLSFMNNQIVGDFYDAKIGFSASLTNVEGINGNASLYLATDPNIVIDFNKCTVPTFRTNMWRMGFGIDGNTGAHQHGLIGTRAALAGSYHANLRSSGCDGVPVGLPNHIPYNNAHKLAVIELNATNHYDNDFTCCKSCQGNTLCDAWHTTKGYKDNGRGCTLSSLWSPSSDYHSNWKFEATPLPKVGLAKDNGYLNVFGDTQAERDAACAHLCEEDDKCGIWQQSTKSSRCVMQTALRNSGWLGVARGVVNWIVDGLLHKLLEKMVKGICKSGGVQVVMKLLEAAEAVTKVHGNGSVNIGVPEDFWETGAADFWNNTAAFEALTFPSQADGLSSIVPDNVALKDLVGELVRDIEQDVANGKVADQLGSAFAFFTGSFIKAVIEKKAVPDPPQLDEIHSFYI